MFELNNVLHDEKLKHKKVVFEFSITANATPASKKTYSDLPGIAYVRTEGLVAAADAIEDLSATFTTADDENTGNSVFGLLIRGGADYLGQISKVLKISVSETSTALSTALAVTKHGTGGLSAGGNVAFSIAGTGLRLDTESPKICVELDYMVSE